MQTFLSIFLTNNYPDHIMNRQNTMDKKIGLSYLIVTRNKLPYLRITLQKIISQKKPDEEILVADGASTDGTGNYLAGLKENGKIDYFVSEPDFGVAHALNKLILIAKGDLFMSVPDDDAFNFSIVAKCKEFMLEHTEFDLVCTEGGVLYPASGQNHGYTMRALNFVEDYKKWQKNHTPFPFCELGQIMRRSSLPVLGLRDIAIRRADTEFSLRVTSGKTKIAWYSGYMYVNILNEQSVSKVYMKQMKEETDRLNKYYLGKNRDLFIWERLKVLKNKIRSALITKKRQTNILGGESWQTLANFAEKWLMEKNAETKPEFIYN